MEVLHPQCAGLDVHKDTVVACARTTLPGGKVTHHREVFTTTTGSLLALSDWLESHGCSTIVMEATGVYWKPIWAILEPHFDLILANAQHIKSVPGRKSDINDATWLADLLAHGLIRPSFVPPASIQELRDLTRTRKQLVREVSKHTLRMQKVLHSAGYQLTGVISDLIGVSGRSILRALIAGETDPDALADRVDGRLKAPRPQLLEALRGAITDHHRFLLSLHLSHVEASEQAITSIEVRLTEVMTPYAEAAERLTTIPGVGLTTAQTVIAEIGVDMQRFPRCAQLISWAGLCPRMDESAGKRRSNRLRHGSSWLKTVLVQAAWAAVRARDNYLRAQYYRVKARRGSKKAIVAVAASILRAAYHMLRDGTDYRDLGSGYFDALDRQRTARRLLRRLQDLG